ncbi:MAG: hypothetical protein XD95_0277 [Microgenomates bacterium 39_7]|nr:MAG: hypothetical protein XD95_0277 [Microgenomates bacterium 39_7]
MKKTFSFLLFFGLILSVSPIYAVEDVADDIPPAPAQERVQKREAPVTTIPERRGSPDMNSSQFEEGEARIQAQQANENTQEPMLIREQTQNQVAQLHARRVQKRFKFYNQRLSTIGEKLQNRFRVLEAQGYNLSAAQEQLEQALQKVELGVIQAEEATNQLNEINPEQYQAQRQMALEARDQIEQARISFQQALQLFKDAVQQAITATSVDITE